MGWGESGINSPFLAPEKALRQSGAGAGNWRFGHHAQKGSELKGYKQGTNSICHINHDN